MKVSYFFGKKFYEHKLARMRVLYAHALARQPGVTLEFWGAGWPNYRMEESVRENIQRHYGELDVIWGYKPEDHLDFQNSGVFTFVAFDEMHFDAVLPEIRELNAQLVVMHYQTDAVKFTPILEREGRRTLYLPHAAEPAIFATAARPWAERDIPFLLVGAVSQDTYPLRAKFRTLIEQQLVPGAQIRYHPGERMRSYSHAAQELRSYAAALGRAKIVGACRSVYNYGLAKYSEIAMAGAVVAADIPHDTPQLAPHILDCSVEDSVERLAEKLNAALADDAGLEQRAAASQQAALQHHHIDTYAARLRQAIDEAR